MLRLISALFCTFSAATLTLAAPPRWETPPGWTETRGGAGGQVLRVTTLAADGPGSLAAALAATGPRIIEFAVAGDIILPNRSLRIEHPFVTLAGETAPSPGITLRRGGLYILTHDVIIRHLRVRATDGPDAPRSTRSADGISTGRGAHDVIVDHCSVAWGTDENLSASGPRFEGATPDEWRKNTSHRITFSHCLVAEGLNPGNSKGTLLHDNTTDIAVIGNLYVSHNDRHPLAKGGVRAAIVNNLIYNPGQRVMQFGHVQSQWGDRPAPHTALSIVGNVARKGPASAPNLAFFEVWPAYADCALHLADNLFLDRDGRPLSSAPAFRDRTRPNPAATSAARDGSGQQFLHSAFVERDGMRLVDTPPAWPPRLRARPAGETADWVLAQAGARPWDRDALDRDFIDQVRTDRGRTLTP